jgi:uncharacterized protein with ParB-like and HNH nuclease domain
MQITTNKFTLKQLLSSSNEQFIVPGYQRRYAWGHKQHAALFNDMDLLKEDDNHLFGMILCHTGVHTGGLNQSELVDGQQRLTTITLLLLALKRRFEESELKKKAEEIEGLIYCTDIRERQLNKMILGDLDNPDYIKIFKGEGEEDVINKKLWKAYEEYYAWLENFEKEEIIAFYNKLINIAVIIRLDVSFAKDAYKLFESINNRGLKLSPTDIIKNFILGHASKIDNITLEKVKSLWSDIIKNLDEIDTNQFLRQYMCMLLQRRVTIKGLVEEFKYYYVNHVQNSELISIAELYVDEENLADEEIEDFDAEVIKTEKIKKISIVNFLKQIKEASLLYRKIRLREFDEEKINYRLLNLQRILSFPSYIFLLSLLKRDIILNNKIEVLKLIETFMLRRHICQKRTGELDNIFAQLTNVSDANIIADVKSILSENLPEDEEFYDYFPKHIFKGKLVDRARYVLEQIEYHLIKDKGEYKLSAAIDVHLEHIVPQTITTKKAKKEYGDWVEYLGDNAVTKHRRYVSRIGNLTLIAGELNIKASNNPFNNKKDNYKQSNIKLNDSLANYYRQFKFQQIDERGKELTDIALKIWKF